MDHILSSPVQYIKGIGPQRASLLHRLGIQSVRDALFHFPFRYEDRRSITKIAALIPEKLTTVCGRVTETVVVSPSPRKRPHLTLLEVTITDGTGLLKAKWFNQPYLRKVFTAGQVVVLYGTAKTDYRARGRFFSDSACFEMTSPEYELLEDNDTDVDQIHTGRIVPIYPSTEGLSQKQMRSIMYSIVSSSVPALSDSVPPSIIETHHLSGLRESFYNVHFPKEDTPLEDLNKGVTPYHQRLAFDELFILQLGLAAIKKGQAMERGISFSPHRELIRKLLSQLPFTLTRAQERVFQDIIADMRSPYPMNRLIQGDVGSGKTIVAVMSMLAAVECGYQAALMAPTEILAEQHFANIHRLLKDLGVSVRLLTGSQRSKDLDAIASGDADVVIGTHALIQAGVSFKNLGLIVIDEQHRFGVMQRATLRKKGTNPDTLVMTATPIPRTLALTLYGDLDYSIIDELPPNRSPIVTLLLYEKQKSEIYRRIEDETRKGRQVYVVYPVIEESEKTDLKAAITGMERLQDMFRHCSVGLIHGRMKAVEREEVMSRFKRGAIHILVSTTVIEVGVDVPNATLMVIIHAERFGLAQLHQLRGRVGRAAHQSYCILLAYHTNIDAKKRLQVLVKTNDGFTVAEEDLSIRGPGEFFGTRQSGMPDLKAANLVRDVRLLETARKEAFSLLEKCPTLETYPHLTRSVEEFWGRRLEVFKTA